MIEQRWLIVTTTLSNGRRWYEAAISGQATTGNRERAKVYTDRGEAERIARLYQRDIDRGRGGAKVFVVVADGTHRVCAEEREAVK